MRSQTSETTVTEARDSIIIELRDTIREVTSVTVQLNPLGDTVKVTTVTDRTSSRDRSQLRVKSEKLKVERDTVYIERDSLQITAYGLRPPEQSPAKKSPFVSSLKWIFWILLALALLIVTLRIFVFRR